MRVLEAKTISKLFMLIPVNLLTTVSKANQHCNKLSQLQTTEDFNYTVYMVCPNNYKMLQLYEIIFGAMSLLKRPYLFSKPNQVKSFCENRAKSRNTEEFLQQSKFTVWHYNIFPIRVFKFKVKSSKTS